LTETYDTAEDSMAVQPFGCVGGRKIEAIDHGGYFYVMVYIDTNNEMIYAYGDTNSWTTQALTGGTSITSWDAGDVIDCALAVDHNNDYVHIVFMGGDNVYHMRLEDPDDPTTAGSWTDYVGATQKYKIVNNASHDADGCLSICVDDSTGLANGNDYPHVVWSEDMAGTPHVHYNVGDGAGNEFTVGSELVIDDGVDPTIININDEGRRLYLAFVDATGTHVDCIRHTIAGPTTTLGNWRGPVNAGASIPDPVLNAAGGHTSIAKPVMSWYWDQDERVLFTALSSGLGSNAGRSVLFLDGGGGLTAEHNISGHELDPIAITNTQVLASDFRVFVQGVSEIQHAREGADVGLDYEWDSNSLWYKLADTVSSTTMFMNSEWRGLEHADGGVEHRRSHCLWLNDINDVYFSEARENTPIINTLNAPAVGADEDETGSIDIVWDNADLESDGQTNFSLQVDDDPNFGSPVVDDSWSVDVTTTRTIAGSTLTAGKIYYWRVRTRDGEIGDEQDPYSDEEWKNTVSEEDSSLRWFYTAAQLVIEIDAVEQQSDKDVYIDMRLSSTLSINAELDDDAGPSTDYAQYRVTDGSWTNIDVIIGESTSDPVGPLTTSPTGTYYRLAWDCDADEAAYEGLVDIRVRGQYSADSKGMGFTEWVEFTDVPIDNLAPTVTLGVPDTLIIVEKTPTLHCSGGDYSGIEFQFEIDDNGGYLSPEQSGWQDANSYRVVTPLTSGLWYFRAKGRDKSVAQNEGSWDEGTFTIAASSFVGTVLSDGDNDVTLNIINNMVFSIHNSVIEYDNILNDYDEVGINQNLVEMRGRMPLEVSMTLFFNSGYSSGEDVNRMFEWKRSETKLSLESVDGKMVTFGDESYEEYSPNRWVVISIKPIYNPARTDSIHLNVKLREVEP